jgi:hypothetical protein
MITVDPVFGMVTAAKQTGYWYGSKRPWLWVPYQIRICLELSIVAIRLNRNAVA